MNPADDQNLNDVNKQYQDILNKYASDIKNVTPEAETPPIEPAATMVEAPSAPVEAPPIVPEPSVLDEVPPTPVITPPPLPLSPPSFVVDGPLTPPETQPKKSGNIFKYLFYISFLVFLGVCGAIAYTLFFNPPTPPSSNQTATPTPTPSSTATCQLNDKTYQVGESVPSADGCNSCSCSSDGTIACTTMACDTTPGVSPTPSTTSSAVPKDWKTYKDVKYKYSISYPSPWKTSVGDNGLTINFFAKSTDAEFVSVTIQDNPTSTEINKWLVDKSIVPANNDISAHTSVSEITVAGIKSVSVTTPVNGGQTSIYIPKGNKIFSIYNNVNQNTSSTEDLYLKNVDTMNNMVSTFKFL